ncbi:MAG: fimbrial protein [Chania sp.]
MMKKNIYCTALLLAFGAIFSAQGADGNVTITGEFFVPTCNLNAESKNMTVPLGNIQRSMLKTTGSTSPEVLFTLKFSDCVADTGVNVSFIGTTAGSDATVLLLDDPVNASTAQNVGLQIINEWGGIIRPNVDWNGYMQAPSDGDFSLTYKVAYKALNDNVTPGDANATVEYNVIYQ